MLDLSKDVKFIKGVGPARAKLLNALGIFTLEDLITYFPRDYEDRGKPKNIVEIEDGEDKHWGLEQAFPYAKQVYLKE